MPTEIKYIILESMLVKYSNTIKYFTFSIIKSFQEDKYPILAAALSYYAIFSLAPFLVLITFIIGLLLGDADSKSQILNQLDSILGTQATDLIERLVQASFNPRGQTLAVVLGFFGVVVAVIGFLDQLEYSFCSIWKLEIDRGFIHFALHKFKQLSYVLYVSLVFVLGLWFNELSREYYAINLSVIFGLLFIIIFAAYKYFIITKTKNLSVFIGSSLTLVLLFISQFILSWYIDNFARVSAYGAAGSLVVILLWVFYMSQVLLFGSKVIYLHQHHKSEIIPNSNINLVLKAAKNESQQFKLSVQSLIFTALLVVLLLGKFRDRS
ncbi:MAG: YihY/virulence factor BrkB family protein [Patescibacteria group bacterium]